MAARIQVNCELPNSSLYTFTGNLLLDGRTLPLSPNQVLLRGCMLRNTEHVLGIAIFTGHETKVCSRCAVTLGQISGAAAVMAVCAFVLAAQPPVDCRTLNASTATVSMTGGQ